MPLWYRSGGSRSPIIISDDLSAHGFLFYNFDGIGGTLGPVVSIGQGVDQDSGPYSFVPLALMDQGSAATVSWPVGWSIPFPSGTVASGTPFRLYETLPGGTATSILAQQEIVDTWPDSTVRWLHLYGVANWVGSSKSSYELRWGSGLIPPVGTPLSVVETSTTYDINTGNSSFSLLKKYPVVTSGAVTGGGPIAVTSGGSYFSANLAGNATVTVEQSGNNVFTVRYENWYSGLTQPFAKYITRISAYRNTPWVNFNHATVFATGMKNTFVNSLGVHFSGFGGQFLTRWAGQKTPTATSGNAFYQWPPYLTDTNVVGDYSLTNVHRFAYLTKGPYLNCNLPSGYLSTLSANSGEYIAETQLGYAISGDMGGVAMHNEFAINLGASGTALQQIYELNPIGYIAPSYMVSTRALGNLAAIGDGNYTDIDNIVINSQIGYFNVVDKFGGFGWHIYGNGHSAIYPGLGRPELLRLWSNNHYQQVSTLWKTYYCSANTGILDLARRATDYHSSINQVKLDIPNTGVQPVLKGMYRHCKALIPWGHRGIADQSDTDHTYIQHYTDAVGSLWGWLVGRDRWSKESYENWYNVVITGSLNNLWVANAGGTPNREVNTSIYHALISYEYTRHPTLLTIINSLRDGVITSNFTGISPGRLWWGDWVSKYIELFPGDTTFNNWVVSGANNSSNILGDDSSIELSYHASAYQINNNPSYIYKYSGYFDRIINILYSGSNTNFTNYGLGFGPLGDGDRYLASQWPRFKATLNNFNMARNQSLGTVGYFNGVAATDLANTLNRGTAIYIYNNTGSSGNLNIRTTKVPIGNNPDGALAIRTVSSSGFIDSVIPDNYNADYTSTVQNFAGDTYTNVIPTGLSRIGIAGTQLNAFAPLTNFPELQIIRNVPASPITYQGVITSGLFYPLVPVVSGTFSCPATFANPTINLPGGAFLQIGNSGFSFVQGESMSFTITQPTPIFARIGAAGVFTCMFSGGTSGNLALYGSAANISSLLNVVSGSLF